MTCVFLVYTSLQSGPQGGRTALGTHEIVPPAAFQNLTTEKLFLLLLEKYGFILDYGKHISYKLFYRFDNITFTFGIVWWFWC